MTPRQSTIGIVGLGKMGRPLGGHLLRAGYAVVGCDPVPAAADAAREVGISVLRAPREVAAASDFVIVLVGFDSDVETVLFGADGLLAGARPGLAVGIGSTISPSYARALIERTQGSGVALLDMPSARGESAIQAGEVLIFGGGDPGVFERWRPALSSFASDIFHLGPFGAGQVAKMVNNLILWACMSANDEGLRLGESLGLEPDRLREALAVSSAQNWSLSTRAEDRPMPWAEKDMMIVLQEADTARLSVPVCGVVKEAIKAYKIRRNLPTPKETAPKA